MKNHSHLKFLSYAIALLILPVLLANLYYVDDMGRATIGYTNWGADGRPIADLVMKIINFRSHLVDLYPLPLIFGSIILIISLNAYTKVYLPSQKIYAIIPLTYLLAPSTPEILLYRFDSLTLLISISLPLIAYSYRYQQEYKNILLGIAVVVGTYSTYQASVNLFVILAAIELIKSYSDNESNKLTLLRLASRIGQFIIASLLYLLVVVPKYFSGNHTEDHPGIASESIIKLIVDNFISYYTFVNNSFMKGNGTIMVALFLVLTLIAITLILLSRKTKQWNIQGILLTAIILITPFAVLIMSVGSLLILEAPVSNFPRIYVGVGGVILFFNMVIMLALKEKTKLFLIVPLAAFLYTLIMVSAVTNAIKSQEYFTSILIQEVKTSAANLVYKHIVTVGSFPPSEVFANSEKNFPIISAINRYSPGWWWTNKRFEFEGIKREWLPATSAAQANAINSRCSTAFKAETDHFILYQINNILVIDFTKGCN